MKEVCVVVNIIVENAVVVRTKVCVCVDLRLCDKDLVMIRVVTDNSALVCVTVITGGCVAVLETCVCLVGVGMIDEAGDRVELTAPLGIATAVVAMVSQVP